jgi:hypothetical protein
VSHPLGSRRANLYRRKCLRNDVVAGGTLVSKLNWSSLQTAAGNQALGSAKRMLRQHLNLAELARFSASTAPPRPVATRARSVPPERHRAWLALFTLARHLSARH